ncbi:leucine-rich repeats and immunoglobulin-like domains protein 2 [Protopterus annectens]|uniref:leucine-rich repeats and immunoglobulin-like domains protein 2 n=1 Tax=Protopterus annectens TaxID=7888 RepID=UPI001CFB342F|nr:leucine-rich repeats and immunoglobulin-like domains protein 2 [Protopterus annectens]
MASGSLLPPLVEVLQPLVLLLVLLSSGGVAAVGSCPALCACREGVLDCSRRKLSVIPFSLPSWITELELSHNRITSTNYSALSSESQLQDVKINYNELTAIPSFGEATSGITQLSLVHNKIPEINTEQLQLYTTLEFLDLSSNLISEVGLDSFPQMQLRYLNLSNNRITTLEPGCFQNISTSLLVLKLNRNRISMIPPKIFKLPQLQLLELKRNRIKIVDSLTFQGMESLKSLKLQRNGISTLMDGAFFGLISIEELELEHNNLTEVNKGWLYGLRTLQKLHVSQNAISKISADAWEFCQKLYDLDLSYNQLTRLDESAFVGLTLLEHLNLGDNRVSHIAEGIFKGLSNLQALSLKNNEISWAIEDASELFAGLDKLTKLVLQGNKIKSIPKKAFAGLVSLEQLDLINNAIMSIQGDAFAHMALNELLLNSSSLLCDCQLRWLPQWLANHNFQRFVTASCAHPEWLSGKSIFTVHHEDFVCDDFLKPVITLHPQTTVALKGMNVTFTCIAVSSSDTPISTSWRKDSEVLYDAEIENFARYKEQSGEVLEYTTVLHIFNVNFTDEGKYQCVVTNHFGSNYSSKAKLTVNELPSFMKTPMDITVRTGYMARLECAAEGHPTPQIAWQKDGGTDFPAARERRMHVMPEDDVFFIADVKIEDMGLYSCTAQNTAGSVSANASLTVLETPSFIRPLEDRTVARGETAVLQCIAGGSPPPRLNWTKDDGPLTVTERHFFAAANQLLIIVDASTEDAGRYTCIMSNALGTERGHIYLNVVPSPNCDSSQSGLPYEEDSWTTVGIVIIVVVCCVVGTSLIWVIVIYHMRRKNEDYSITNAEDLTLPVDIPSYLSSQGTLSDPQEGYSNSEAGSHQQLMPPSANGYLHRGTDGIYLDTGSETDTDIFNPTLTSHLHGKLGQYSDRSSFHPEDPQEGLTQLGNLGGPSPMVICSDCYDNANIYSRTREYCPYTYIAEEDPTRSTVVVQIPRDAIIGPVQHEDASLCSTVADKDMSTFLVKHEGMNNPRHSTQVISDTNPRLMWSMNQEVEQGTCPQITQQLAPVRENQAVDCEKEHNSHEKISLSRTQSIQECKGTT